MSTDLNVKCRNMILGALVADAAAMGLHWIYDQPHIRKIAPQAPEFRTPDAGNYEDIMGFFAHSTRSAGAQSQYGEQTLVMLRSLVASGGQYDRADFADTFRAHFGYGGAYVGYIDHATRDSLDNRQRFEDAAMACARSVGFDGDPRISKGIVAKALPLLERYSGEALYHALEVAVRASHDDDAIVAYAVHLLNALKELTPPTGAYDLQLPAIAKLPSLVALYMSQGESGATFDTDIASAVKVTNDHPTAAEYGKISAHMMMGAVTDGTTAGAVAAGRTVAGGDAAILLDEARAMAHQDNSDVTKHFGMACDLPFGVPSAAHNIATAPSYSDAVRRNIYSGGDTCGRAILVGAVMGAIHGIGGAQGIPVSWTEQLETKPEVDRLLIKLFD